MCLEDRREGGAPIDRRKPAGIAVCEDIHWSMWAGVGRFGNKRQSMVADSAVGGHILVADFLGEHPGTVCALRFGAFQQQRKHSVERPAQVDRGGARRQQFLTGAPQIILAGITGGRKKQSAGSRRSDQRCTADNHFTDGKCCLARGGKCPHLKGKGQ